MKNNPFYNMSVDETKTFTLIFLLRRNLYGGKKS